MAGRGDLRRQLGLGGGGELLGVGDKDGGGHRVVFGLADQVGGDVHRVGAAVGEDRDLGGTGLGVDADAALEETLGGGDVDVAGPGDEVHGRAVLGAVREHRDGLGAAGGVHLVDAEEGAGGEDRRVRQAAELLLRRGRHGDALDAGLLRGDDVHDDGGGVDRASAGDVEPDALDGHPLLGDRAAGDDLGGVRGAALLAVDEAGAADRLLQGGAHGEVERLEGVGDRVGGDPDRVQPDPVELLPPVDHRC